QEAYPGQPTVPGTQHDVDFMVKDSKRFADSGGWGWARSTMTPRPARSRPQLWLTSRRRVTTPNAGSPAIRWWRTAITFSRSTRRGERALTRDARAHVGGGVGDLIVRR